MPRGSETFTREEIRPIFISMIYGHVVALGDDGSKECALRIRCLFLTLEAYPGLLPLRLEEVELIEDWFRRARGLSQEEEARVQVLLGYDSKETKVLVATG